MRTAAAFCALLAMTAPAFGVEPISGPASVVDGDTISVGGYRIRLAAIDAPEKAQTCEGRGAVIYLCGHDATAVLIAMVRSKTVTCFPEKIDRYGRVIARCSTDDIPDIGSEMVRRGWAIPYLQYGGAVYSEQETKAKAERLGLHSGRFEMPADWRKEHKR